MLDELRNWFFTLAPWTIAIPAFLAIAGIRKQTPALKMISAYLVLSLVTQVVSFTLWKQNVNNLPLLHLYTLLEFLFLLRFYALLLKGFVPAIIFQALAVLFPVFALLDAFFIEGLYVFNTLVRSVEALIFTFLSVCWLLKAMPGNEQPGQAASPGINPINAGFLVYFSGSMMLFSISNFISKLNYSLSLNIWTLHTCLLVFLYLMLTIGLLKWRTN